MFRDKTTAPNDWVGQNKTHRWGDHRIRKCCICGDKFRGLGNNAEPVNDGRCCDECNHTRVVSARIQTTIVQGDGIEKEKTMADLDCCNPNCKNKAQSEDSVTCKDCTLAMEVSDAGICEVCKCWTETAQLSGFLVYCPACYKENTND